jgi:hypothetical protein
MSFIQSVTGPSFQTGFTFNTNNISVDDISCNTLEANTAVIQDLTTVNFQPIILNTSTLSASAAYIDDIFCQNISSTGIIDAFQINVCNIDIENVSVEKATMTEADVSLLIIKDQTNTKQSEIQRDNDILTIAGGYVDPIDPSIVYEGQINITSGAGAARAINISLDKANISGNVIDAITTNSVSVNASGLYSDSVIAIDVDADEGNFGVVNTPFLNVSTVGVSDIVTANISVINASVNNLSVYHTLDIKDQDGSNHHGSIYNNTSGLHIAGNGEVIRIRAGGTFDQIVLSKTQGQVNISNLNTSTITGIDVTLTGTMDSTTIIANDINTPLLNVSNISVDQDISCQQLICADVICNDITTNFLFDVNLTNNLSAGSGITIVSVNDVPVISSTGETSDPLNISKLNVSNISVDVNVSVGGSFTCNDAQIDDLFNCDMTNTLRGGTSGFDLPFNNISVEFSNGTLDTLVMLKPNLQLYGVSLLPDILTLAPPTFEMTTGTAQITNANISNLSVTNLSLDTLTCDLTSNLTAGVGITITSVGGKPTIASLGGGVTDPLNISKINASNISVDVDVTIARDLQVQRYLDAGKPTFIMLRRTGNLVLTSASGGQTAVFNSNTTGQINGQFGTASGSDVIVSTGGWYRVSWALVFFRQTNTGGDRAQVRSYTQQRTSGGSFTFDSAKNTYSSSCYIRRNDQCREGTISGYNFLYIPANGAVRLRMEAMVEGNTTWTSSFVGMQLKLSSNFMVEFVSSAAET